MIGSAELLGPTGVVLLWLGVLHLVLATAVIAIRTPAGERRVAILVCVIGLAAFLAFAAFGSASGLGNVPARTWFVAPIGFAVALWYWLAVRR